MTEVSDTEAVALVAPGGPEISGRLRAIAIVVVVGVVSGIIALTCGGYWLSNFTQAYCMTLAVLGCALLYGQLGLVSLSQWALVGVGGWVSLRVYHYIHPPFFVTMLAGGVGTSVIGTIWGLPALRMRGLYLALVTLMLAGAFQTLVTVISFPVGGPDFWARSAPAATTASTWRGRSLLRVTAAISCSSPPSPCCASFWSKRIGAASPGAPGR